MGNVFSCNICSWCFPERDNDCLYEPLLLDDEREAVSNLLQYLENSSTVSFFQGEPLKALTILSYSSNIDLQRSAALAFAEITERNSTEVESSVLEILLYLLKENADVEIQRAASAAMGNLAVNVHNKLKIVKLGGLDPLVRLIQSSNVEVQCNSVGCITNLATHEQNKKEIARSGALGPLIRLAKNTRDIRVLRNATGALLNMTHSEENRRELADCGALNVLIGLLGNSDVDVVYYCTTAISNMAVDSCNRIKLSKELRLIPELIELINSPSNKVQCQGVLALRNLASDEQYQVEICNHPNFLPSLLALLNGSIKPHPMVQLAAVACIRNISIHPSNEKKIIESGFLKPLVLLLSNDNEEIQCHAISALRNLAAGGVSSQENDDLLSQENKEKIMDSGLLTVVQDMINEFNCGKRKLLWPVVSEMTACLAVLALNENIKPKLLRQDIIKTLLPLTQYTIPCEIQGNAAAALGNLASKTAEMESFLENWDGIISYIVRFLEPDFPENINEEKSENFNSGTFQHIAVWTILQFCEKGDTFCKKLSENKHLVTLIKNLKLYNTDDEVLLLRQRVISYFDNEF
jgi:vacuolar protein 8